jgi:hypothetical protein
MEFVLQINKILRRAQNDRLRRARNDLYETRHDDKEGVAAKGEICLSSVAAHSKQNKIEELGHCLQRSRYIG